MTSILKRYIRIYRYIFKEPTSVPLFGRSIGSFSFHHFPTSTRTFSLSKS
nr:MAG TPA: hypothetical protein [Caudoviricetes sp.]